MGEMRLLSLHLRNFKGIQDFILDARGKSLDIYGDNATRHFAGQAMVSPIL